MLKLNPVKGSAEVKYSNREITISESCKSENKTVIFELYPELLIRKINRHIPGSPPVISLSPQFSNSR